MSFAQPGWLLLGLLGVLVLVLHARRRTVVEVSTVVLWQRLAPRDEAPVKWRLPRVSLPLLLQLLAVILLVLGLARPQLGPEGPGLDHWIVLVDTSGSMSAKTGGVTRSEQALAWLQRELRQFESVNGSDRPKLSIIAVGPEVDVLGARLGRPEEAGPTLSDLVPSDGEAPWEDAAVMLSGLIVGEESVRVTVLTDGAGAKAARAAVTTLLPETELAVLEFGCGVDNSGLVRVRVTPLDLKAGRWKVDGAVRSFTSELRPITLSVLFTPEGTESALPWAEQQLTSQKPTAPFSFELELPGAGLLEVRLPDDALASDNHTQVVLEAAPRSVRVLQLGPDNPPLQRALEAVGGVELFRADALPGAGEKFDLVVVDRVAIPRHPGTHTLWVGGASLRAKVPSPLPNPTPTGWKTESPLSASVDWSSVEPGVAYRVPRAPGADVLLEASGVPLVQARTTGVGREVVVAFDLLTSPWIEQLGFPVFVANLVRWVAPWKGQVSGFRCTVGEACPLDPSAIYGGLTLRPVSGEGHLVTLPSPFVASESQVPAEQAWAPLGFTELFRPRQAGTYRLSKGGELLVVDAPAGTESDLRTPAATLARTVTESDPHRWPLFRWLLLAGLLVLVLEAWVAGRGSDRFLRPSGLRRGDPLAARRRLILSLRAATLLWGFLALLGVPLPLPYREQRLVLVVDDADLYGQGGRDRIEEALEKTRELTGGPRREGVVLLGQGGQVLAGPGEPLQLLPDNGAPRGANLASALDLSQGLLGKLDSGRIAVVASGSQTRGEVARVLPQLVASETPVDVLPIGGVPPGEVLIESLSLPDQLYQGDSFLFEGVIYSSATVPATVRVWREGKIRGEQTVRLTPGRNRVETGLSEEVAGRYLYEYEVIAGEDVFPNNNRNGVVVEVKTKAKVALVTPQPQWGRVLADALTLQGLSVEVMAPSQVPYTLDDLLGYDVVTLANVPAIDLHSEQQELLETWVREYGGGLLVLGGENSFGPGGYYQTPLERVSPLSSRIPREAPKVAMLFVLDRSGSMQQSVGEASRLDIAKQATLDAAKLLHQESLTGIVVFDSEATTLVPLQQVEGGAGLASALGPLQPGGGTAIYPGLVAAFEQMRSVEATARHIVVMTDGLSEPGDFDGILDRIASDKITVSTVAVGQGADTKLLQDIARRGGGAFHATTDFRALPSILSQEALLLSSTPIEEVSFTPVWQDRKTAFLQGLPNTLPPLSGYVRTSSKGDAAIHLRGPKDDPILASWRYGIGRVVAFASQGAGEWAREWLDTPSYPLLWSQAVRWVLPPVAKPGFHLSFERAGDEVSVWVEAINGRGSSASGVRPAVTLYLPGQDVGRPLALVAAEPGRYRANFVAEQSGRYRVRVMADGAAGSFSPAEGEIYLGYSSRYDFGSWNAERLQGLAAVTGGRVLFGDEPLAVGAVPTRWRWAAAWPLWTVLAMTFLTADLVLRYAPNLLKWRRPAPATRGRLGVKEARR